MITVEQISLQQGRFKLDSVSFQIERGEYAVLMGKTGSGKTSILEAICGLRPVRSGHIRLAGCDVTALPPASRGIGYVPQDGALFPTMTVADQLGFALRIRRIAAREVAARVTELSRLLEIEHLLPRYPRKLSGGEAQRVALGRALAFRPPILLLDEPLSALDDATRKHMYALLKRVREHAELTAMHVTHSPAEAAALGDCLLRLEAGQVTRHDPATVCTLPPIQESA